MTDDIVANHQLDMKRADEAIRQTGDRAASLIYSAAVIAARLGREGWTPPDPLEAEVSYLVNQLKGIADIRVVFRMALERGIEIGKAER